MKVFLGAILVCLYLANAAATKLADKEGYYYEQRPRLGHFKEHPFIDLYKIYATAFVVPKFPEREPDDYRNYLPSGDECVTFLRKFRIDKYVVRDLDEVVVLDACLGYLFESTYQDKDMERSQHVANHLDGFKNDEELKRLYDQTRINSLEKPAKECVGDLLVNSIRAKNQFKTVSCNSEWLNLFNVFAECQKVIPRELRDTDSYLHVIYDLVKRRGVECFHAQINTLNQAVRGEYGIYERVSNSIAAPFSNLKRQARDRFWDSKLTEVLRVTTGTKKAHNIRDVHEIVRGVSLDEPNMKERFLNNLAQYAQEKISPKKDKKTDKDYDGIERYDALIDKLCNNFRQHDGELYYDYTTPFVRMLKMLDYEDIYGIDKSYFLRSVLTHDYETAPLYLSIASCNFMTFTEGSFIRQPQNSPLRYKVVFKADTTEMVRWPDAGYY